MTRALAAVGYFTIAAYALIAMPPRANADPTNARARLSLSDSAISSNRAFANNRASNRSRYVSQPRGTRLSDSTQNIFISESTFELSSESEDLVRSQKQDSLSVSYYRNLQNLRFSDDNPSAAQFDELDSESFAQHLCLFFSTKNIISLVRSSDLGTIYRDVSSEIKKVGNYAAVSAGRNPAGDVEVVHGEAKRARLFDFRLGLSSRNGIEPRLKLPDDLSIKYDINSGTTLLEYEVNF